jgi:hypothetical protein
MIVNLGYVGCDLTDPVKCERKGKKILEINKNGE